MWPGAFRRGPGSGVGPEGTAPGPPPPQAVRVPPCWSLCLPLPLVLHLGWGLERGPLKVQQRGLGGSTKFLDEVSGEPKAHTAHTHSARPYGKSSGLHSPSPKGAPHELWALSPG